MVPQASDIRSTALVSTRLPHSGHCLAFFHRTINASSPVSPNSVLKLLLLAVELLLIEHDVGPTNLVEVRKYCRSILRTVDFNMIRFQNKQDFVNQT